MAVTNSYETFFLLSMNLGEEGIAAQVKKFTELKGGKAAITAEDEERIRQAAIEEYLKSQQAQDTATDEPEPVPEKTEE